METENSTQPKCLGCQGTGQSKIYMYGQKTREKACYRCRGTGVDLPTVEAANHSTKETKKTGKSAKE